MQNKEKIFEFLLRQILLAETGRDREAAGKPVICSQRVGAGACSASLWAPQLPRPGALGSATFGPVTYQAARTGRTSSP